MSVRVRSLDDPREEDGGFPGREKNSGSRAGQRFVGVRLDRDVARDRHRGPVYVAAALGRISRTKGPRGPGTPLSFIRRQLNVDLLPIGKLSRIAYTSAGAQGGWIAGHTR